MERLKVLVVDDESRMRKLVRDFLVKKDFEVLEPGMAQRRSIYSLRQRISRL